LIIVAGFEGGRFGQIQPKFPAEVWTRKQSEPKRSKPIPLKLVKKKIPSNLVEKIYLTENNENVFQTPFPFLRGKMVRP